MVQPGSTDQVPRPFLGPNSFAIKDRDRLYGRNTEAERMRDQIEASSISLLHARSGAGKTSFLNARVISDLERAGWSAARARPENSLSDEIRRSVLIRLAPDPDAEVSAIDTLLAEFSAPWAKDYKLSPASSLVDAKQAVTHERELVRLGKSPHGARAIDRLLTSELGGRRAEEGTLSVFQRFLDAYRGAGMLVDHIWMHANRSGHEMLPLGPLCGHDKLMTRNQLVDPLSDATLAAMRDFFDSAAYRNSLSRFHETHRSHPTLLGFFQALERDALQYIEGWKFFLLLDQFEEMYTRKEPAAGRAQFLAELEELLASDLHVNALLSMRDEHIAELDDLGQLGVHLTKFRLHPINKQDLSDIIREPARQFGGIVEDDAYEILLREFTERGERVELTEVQLAMDYLWTHPHQGDAVGRITGEQIAEAGGVDAILDGYLDRVLDTFVDPFDLFEALSMLDPLVTRNGRRNIVLVDELLDAPGGGRKLRERILNTLVSADLLSKGRRDSGANEYVEITHEFLIGPALRAISLRLRRNLKLNSLSQGLHRLSALSVFDFRGADIPPLSSEAFDALNDNSNRIALLGGGASIDSSEHVDPSGVSRAAEIMFRSAVLLGKKHEAWTHWADQIESRPADILTDIQENLKMRKSFIPGDLERLRDFLDAQPTELDSEAREFLLRNTIESSRLAPELIIALTRRMIDDLPSA